VPLFLGESILPAHLFCAKTKNPPEKRKTARKNLFLQENIFWKILV